MTDAILSGDVETALRELNDLCKHGKELNRLISNLLSHFRNLLIFQVSKGDSAARTSEAKPPRWANRPSSSAPTP